MNVEHTSHSFLLFLLLTKNELPPGKEQNDPKKFKTANEVFMIYFNTFSINVPMTFHTSCILPDQSHDKKSQTALCYVSWTGKKLAIFHPRGKRTGNVLKQFFKNK